MPIWLGNQNLNGKKDIMNSPKDRGSRPVRDHRRSIAAAVLGTTGGLVLLFHYNGIFGANATSAPAAQAMAPTMQSSNPMMSPSAAKGSKAAKAAKAKAAKAARAKARASKAAMAANNMAGNDMAGNNMAAGGMGGAPVTVLGPAVNTRWGVVQVRLTVQGGKITASDTVQAPHASAMSKEINARALPILNQEVVQAQSGMVNAVSGASVTSGGYMQSLQAAVDKAHLQ
jgi:hypothetical protein